MNDLTPSPGDLRRTMGLRDLILFYLVTGFSLRWMATSAVAGPSAVVIWLGAGLFFYVPLVFSVLELSSRYPKDGGVYIWSREALGETAGFMAGWTYWACNLPYYPGVLYFTAANALYIGGGAWQHLEDSSLYFVLFSLAGLALAVLLNVVGLNVGKWLHNLGAIGLWIPALILLGMGTMAAVRYGLATPFDASDWIPSTRLRDIVFWSTIAFALGGVEAGSFLGEEIKDARRTIPKALLIAGSLIITVYVLGTMSILAALHPSQVSSLQGVMQPIQAVEQRAGLSGFVPVAAVCIVLGGLGAIGAWFTASARIPFVAGIDRFLPPAFGRLHPRWGTPHVALLVQAAIAAVFIFLGQAGTTVKGAYEVLVNMAIISYLIPFLLLFASLIKVQQIPAAPGVIRVPGGPLVARVAGTVGFIATSISILLALVPSPDEPNPGLAAGKTLGLTILLLAIGWVIYRSGRALRYRRA